MASSIIGHHHFNGAVISVHKKLRLFFTVAAIVLFLGCIKTAVHYFGLEFPEPNTLRTSGIGDASSSSAS